MNNDKQEKSLEIIDEKNMKIETKGKDEVTKYENLQTIGNLETKMTETNEKPDEVAPMPKEKQKHTKRKKTKFEKILFPFLPTILATLIYLLTLMGCYDSLYACLKKYPPKAMLYGLYVMGISGFLYTLQIYLVFIRKLSLIYILVEVLIISFLCFIYDTGTNLISHGGYNRIILFSTMLFWMIIIGLSISLYRCFKHYPKLILFIGSFLVISISFYAHYTVTSSCNHWRYGFKNSVITNDSPSCNIESPQVCYYKIFDGFFDVSRMLKAKCRNSNVHSLSTNLLPYTNVPNASYIGFPLTQSYLIKNSSYSTFQQKVLNNMIDLEDSSVPETIRKNTEVAVNFKNGSPELMINVVRNQTLIQERNILYETKTGLPLARNILYVFIDSISRANFSRKLKKFWGWLEEKYVQGYVLYNLLL
jgi:hypothetical protein